MMAVDEAKLEELYQEVLRMEPDMKLEGERLREMSQRPRLKERRENQEIRLLRESQRTELLENASSIFRWASDFTTSAKGKKILSTLGEMTLFRAHYFNCKPREEKEYEAWLTCDHSGMLRYREFYRGIMGRHRGRVLATPKQMVKRLHPNYILSAGEAIATGSVWKEVECAIRWRAEIFDIRRQRRWWPPRET